MKRIKYDSEEFRQLTKNRGWKSKPTGNVKALPECELVLEA